MATSKDIDLVLDAFRNSSGWMQTGMFGSVLNALPGVPPITVIGGKDEEILNKAGITTAFATAGPAVVFTEKFLAKLTTPGLVFLLLHECGHIAMRHHARRGTRNAQLWNIACDYIINGMLMYHILPAFSGLIKSGDIGKALSGIGGAPFKINPQTLFVAGVEPMGLGMTPATEKNMEDHYLVHKRSEEEVYSIQEANIRKERKKEAEANNGSPGQNGSSGGSGAGSPGQGSGSGGGGGNGLEEDGDDHYQGGYELRKRLEEIEGGKELADKLNLPDSPEEEQEIQEKIEDKITENAKIQNLGGSGIGKHINNYIDGTLRAAEGDAAVKWSLIAEDMIRESRRGRTVESEMEGDLLSYMSHTRQLREKMGLRQPVFIPEIVGSEGKTNILAIIDTSGSVSDKEKQLFFREIKDMAKDSEMTITIVSADTVARTRLIIDTENEKMPDILDIKGGGGTDQLGPLGAELADSKKPFDLVITFSDGEFPPYSRKNLVDLLNKLGKPEKVKEIPPIVLLITREHYASQQMKDACETFGPRKCLVLKIEDKQQQKDIELSSGSISVS